MASQAPLTNSTVAPGPAAPAFEAPSELTLASNDPGLNDEEYIARRIQLSHLARKHRYGALPFPDIEYKEHEHATWRAASQRFAAPHEKWACRDYLRGKQALALSSERLPRVTEVAQKLLRETGVGLVPAEGMLNFREFFLNLANRTIPCSIFLRHGSHPEYGTEPDLIHDIIGHVPMMLNREYVHFTQMIGCAVQHVQSEEAFHAFNRLYLFTVEFGLIEQEGQLKVFGAGLLSSDGEMEHVYSGNADRRALDVDEAISRAYNLHTFQDVYYVIPSFKVLVEETCQLIRRFGLDLERILKDRASPARSSREADGRSIGIE